MHLPLLSKINAREAKFADPRTTKESLLVTSAWFLNLLVIALPNGLSSRIGGIGLKNSASSPEIRKAWGPGDAGSLLNAAITWAHGHQIDPTTQFWIVHLWSPGMSIFEVPLIWLEHVGIPIFWSLLIATLILWNMTFYFSWKYGSVLVGRVTLSIASLLLLYSWDFRYIFRDDLFYTEGLGYGLLLLGLLMASWIVLSQRSEGNRRLAVIAGVCLGASIWIRHVSDTGLILFAAVCSLLILWNMKLSKWARNSRQSLSSSKKGNAKSASRRKEQLAARRKEQLAARWRALGASPYLALSAFVGFLVTVPWRIISPLAFHGAPGLMSSASADIPYVIWATNNSPTGKYWGSYGMNWACNIDKQTCATINVDLHSSANRLVLLVDAMRAVLFHPLAFIQNRATYAYRNWIPGGMHLPLNSQMIVALLSGLAFFLVIYLYIRVQDRRKRLLALIWLPFLTMQLAQLAIIHYESRYFIPVRFLILGFAMTLMALLPKKVRA